MGTGLVLLLVSYITPSEDLGDGPTRNSSAPAVGDSFSPLGPLSAFKAGLGGTHGAWVEVHLSWGHGQTCESASLSRAASIAQVFLIWGTWTLPVCPEDGRDRMRLTGSRLEDLPPRSALAGIPFWLEGCLSASPTSEGRRHTGKPVQKGSCYKLPSDSWNTFANHGKGTVLSALAWELPGSEAEDRFDASRWPWIPPRACLYKPR